MTNRVFLLLAVATLLAGCGRQSGAVHEAEERRSVEQREADERRLAELRELEQRNADREAVARSAAIDQERAALADERARLERDRAQLQDEQRAVADRRLAEIRAQQLADEKQEKQRKTELEQQRMEERATAARPVPRQGGTGQSLDLFYKALEPHGDWVEVENYGYCWQPRTASETGWRPYVDGNWAYTNYGWTWVSNEPFGWATYHYGRWARVRRLGWVWVPGSEWAPAWVSWRSSDRYVGWAPLPPEAHSGAGFNAAVDSYYDIGPGQYNFVEVDRFGEATYVGRVVEPGRNVSIVYETANVTNLNYRKAEKGMVLYNDGPQFAEMIRHGRIRRMEVERVEQAPAAGEHRGNILQLLAPFIAPAAKPSGEPSRVRERERGAEIERGWSGGEASAVTRIREQQNREARRAELAPPRPADADAPVPPAPKAPESVRKPALPTPAATPIAAPPAKPESGRRGERPLIDSKPIPARPAPNDAPVTSPKTKPQPEVRVPAATTPVPNKPTSAPPAPAPPAGTNLEPAKPESAETEHPRTTPAKPAPAKPEPAKSGARGQRPAGESRPVANPPAAAPEVASPKPAQPPSPGGRPQRPDTSRPNPDRSPNEPKQRIPADSAKDRAPAAPAAPANPANRGVKRPPGDGAQPATPPATPAPAPVTPRP